MAKALVIREGDGDVVAVVAIKEGETMDDACERISHTSDFRDEDGDSVLEMLDAYGEEVEFYG